MTKLKAKDVMTAKVMVASTDWSVEHLAAELLRRSVSGAPVADDSGKLVGVVSLTDVTRSQAEGVEGSDALNDYYQRALVQQMGQIDAEAMSLTVEPEKTVGDIMTPMVFEVEEDTPVQEVAETMLQGRIHRVFVTRDGELVGVVSAFDLLRVVREA